MALNHEFGLINDINDQRTYESYTPDVYNCISIDDDIIENLLKSLSTMKTYFRSLKRPEYGLAYSGITIIPPESLSQFLDAVISCKDMKQSVDLNELAKKIIQAKEENKYMIHFGI
ncbi:short-chain dehydrogenase [Bacillus pseudomycoides]|uniref:Short-chain dehydrogenase n=1 Tax=Bacillus pseudomycoides TaxID=64104 RepID=A0A2B5R0X6_9BACI|nr:short-chain dehydrogenase [Bacillus pseudomycoides]PDY43822.1 short-chain dehydrogenase [Bacillus pseudomycoides]PEA81612.1 short-chain dehydrogenase [Bacillus pseudomycoides]PED05067.1 short-chain dehydrogenase [Bacillus pseudomycoides]PED69049.1 short-chain dehydrogenase [Bacillus pseudomycoides]PEI37445.1 short-chain dehydrogenase [Bacillus pseudomycoides]